MSGLIAPGSPSETAIGGNALIQVLKGEARYNLTPGLGG
jgi:hypothetical protein